MSFLMNWLKQAFGWLWDLIVHAVEWLGSELLGALMAVLNAMPVPEWLANAPATINSIPASAAFFLQSLQVPSGLSIIVGRT